MGTLLLAFFAGILTVAAPCILPLLPVVIGGSLVGKEQPQHRRWVRPAIITTSLAVSVIIFSLVLKATTMLLGVPQEVWQIIAGSIVFILGLNFIWPHAWESLSAKIGLFSFSNVSLGRANRRKGIWGAVLTGSALGPVFSSCSPTYAFIVATILPTSFTQGLVYLIAYALGLSLTLLLIAIAGQSFIAKLDRLGDPNGWLKRTVGILFVIVGLSVLLGIDKKLQTYVLEQGWYEPIRKLEDRLR